VRSKKSKHQPIVGKRSARLSFFAGVFTFVLLLAAAGCIAFAVYTLLGTRPAQARTVPQPAGTLTRAVAPTPTAEPITWIQIIPPDEETMYMQYIYVPAEYEDLLHYGQTVAVYAAAAVPAPPIPVQYTALPFYINENASLYAAFLQERPYLDVETVIWKVNAFVHVPFYSQVLINHQPNPLFVTPNYRLPYGFSPDELVPVNHDGCHLRAQPAAVSAFRNLRAAARETGFDLAVTSAYRTASRQSELWVGGGRRDGRVARPYHSEHQTGRALDLWGPGGLLDASGPSPTGRWVADNVHEFGFIIRYRAETTHITGYIHEPWHITYVGREIAMYMRNNNILSLEEFVGRNPGVAIRS